MAISQQNYVDISSVVAGASTVGAPSLQHRRVSRGSGLVPGIPITVTAGMLDDLGSVLPDARDQRFARQYFAVKTTPPASRPKSLEFVGAMPDLPTVITGDELSSSEWLGVNPKDLEVTWDGGGSGSISVDTSAAVDVAEAAQHLNLTLESALPELIFSADGDRLVASWAPGGTVTLSGDAATALKLTDGTGATVEVGAPGSIVDAYIAARAVSRNYGSFSIEGLEFEDRGELEKLRDFHLGQNVEHQLYVELSDPESIEGAHAYQVFEDVPMTAFILSSTPNEHKAVIPAGLIDATDYEGRNSVNSIMFRQASGMSADVKTDALKLSLDSIGVNYYGETAVNATPLSFFQKGTLQGTALDPRDIMVAACEQWIKGKIAADVISALVASRVPANKDGVARIRALIENGAVASAVRSGAIQPLKELTPLQREAIFDLTGDELAEADVFQDGYWLDVEIRTVPVDGAEEKHAYYTLIYSKADFVRKVVGSHNLI